MVDNPKLCDNSRLTCKVSGLKRRNPEKNGYHCSSVKFEGEKNSSVSGPLKQHWGSSKGGRGY